MNQRKKKYKNNVTWIYFVLKLQLRQKAKLTPKYLKASIFETFINSRFSSLNEDLKGKLIKNRVSNDAWAFCLIFPLDIVCNFKKDLKIWIFSKDPRSLKEVIDSSINLMTRFLARFGIKNKFWKRF